MHFFLDWNWTCLELVHFASKMPWDGSKSTNLVELWNYFKRSLRPSSGKLVLIYENMWPDYLYFFISVRVLKAFFVTFLTFHKPRQTWRCPLHERWKHVYIISALKGLNLPLTHGSNTLKLTYMLNWLLLVTGYCYQSPWGSPSKT